MLVVPMISTYNQKNMFDRLLSIRNSLLNTKKNEEI